MPARPSRISRVSGDEPRPQLEEAKVIDSTAFRRTDAAPQGRRRSLRGCALAFSALCALPVAAHAQAPAPAKPAGAALDEVVVTARRQVELARQIPTSISVFGDVALEKNHIQNIGDYALKTPNISIQEGATRDRNDISIRGISNIGGGLNTSFAFYIDELNVIALTNNPQLQDIERVEVLRGPQGTFFGRNAAGGAINITTRKPGPTLGGSAWAELARFGTVKGGAVFNAPLAKNLYIRAVGNYDHTDGFIRNVNPVGGSDDQRNMQGRLAVRWLPTPRLTLDLSATHADERSGLESGVPTLILYPGTRTLIRSDKPVADGLPGYPQNKRYVNENNPTRTDYDFTIWNGRINYDAGPVTITSVTGSGDSRRKVNEDADATSLDGVNVRRAETHDSLSQEFRVASNSKDPLRWTLGGIYADERRHGDLSVVAGRQAPLPVPAGTVIRRTIDSGKTKSWALFGEADWHVAPRMTLTYGGRYSSDEVTQAQTIINTGPTGQSAQVFSPVSKQFGAYTSKFAGRYDISSEVSAYAVASQGYRTGGVQLDPALQRREFDPERLWNYEVGIKGSALDRRLRFSAAVFEIKWTDLQVRTIVNRIDPATGALILTQGTENAASASSKGAELELEARPVRAIELGFTAGYLDAKYDSFPNSSIPDVRGTVDLSGKRLLNAPKWTLSSSAQYDFDIGSAAAFLRAEWSYRSELVTDSIVYVAPSQFTAKVTQPLSFPYRTPAFGVWNLRAGIRKGRYNLTAYVENLFNKTYYTGTFDDLYQSGTHVTIKPQRYGVRLAAEF
jgi:iron complex outermembrane receptor protein